MHFDVAVKALEQHQLVGQALTESTPDKCTCGAKIAPGPRVGYEDISERRRISFANHQARALMFVLFQSMSAELQAKAQELEQFEGDDEDGDNSPTAIAIRKIRAQGWREAADYLAVL